MAKRGGFPGGAMPGNMSNLMKQAQRMQRQMEEGQKELETKEFTASAGGGAVEVTVSGKKEVTAIKLAEEIVDPEDIETLQDLLGFKAMMVNSYDCIAASDYITEMDCRRHPYQQGIAAREGIEY